MLEARSIIIPEDHLQSMMDSFSSKNDYKVMYAAMHISSLKIEDLPLSKVRKLAECVASGCEHGFKGVCKLFNRENMHLLDSMHKFYYELVAYADEVGV